MAHFMLQTVWLVNQGLISSRGKVCPLCSVLTSCGVHWVARWFFFYQDIHRRMCQTNVRMCQKKSVCVKQMSVCVKKVRMCQTNVRMCQTNVRMCKTNVRMCQANVRMCQTNVRMCQSNVSPPSNVEVKSAWCRTSIFFVHPPGLVRNEAQRQLYLLPTKSSFSILWIPTRDLENPEHQVAIAGGIFMWEPSTVESSVMVFSLYLPGFF